MVIETQDSNPVAIALEWESDGESSIQMYAWNATRLMKPQNGIPQKVFFAIVLTVLLIAVVTVAITSIPEQDFTMTIIAVGGMLFVYYAFRSIFRSQASAMRWYMDYYRQAVERGEVRSTAGRWSCVIDSECVKYEQVGQKRVTAFPLTDISSLVRVHNRIGLLDGNILLGHLPDDEYNGADLFEQILQRVQLQNPSVEAFREVDQW